MTEIWEEIDYIIDESFAIDSQSCHNELQLLKSLSHPNMMRLQDVYLGSFSEQYISPRLIFVYDYQSNINNGYKLDSIIEELDAFALLKETHIRCIMYQISNAVNYICNFIGTINNKDNKDNKATVYFEDNFEIRSEYIFLYSNGI